MVEVYRLECLLWGGKTSESYAYKKEISPDKNIENINMDFFVKLGDFNVSVDHITRKPPVVEKLACKKCKSLIDRIETHECEGKFVRNISLFKPLDVIIDGDDEYIVRKNFVKDEFSLEKIN